MSLSGFSSAGYAPFSENLTETTTLTDLIGSTTVFNRPTRRSLEEFMQERGQNTAQETQNLDYYNLIFQKIKEKMNKLGAITPANTPYLDDVVNTPEIIEYKEIFNNLKRSLGDTYLKVEKTETELNNAKELYENFCDSLEKMIHVIDSSNFQEEGDTHLKQVLKDKIDSYYEKLDIDRLIEEYEESMKEFKIAKYKLSSIFGNLGVPTTCQICLENQVEYYLDPCGHTICGTCKVSCESKTQCHYCRTKRNSFRKLFF